VKDLRILSGPIPPRVYKRTPQTTIVVNQNILFSFHTFRYLAFTSPCASAQRTKYTCAYIIYNKLHIIIIIIIIFSHFVFRARRQRQARETRRKFIVTIRVIWCILYFFMLSRHSHIMLSSLIRKITKLPSLVMFQPFCGTGKGIHYYHQLISYTMKKLRGVLNISFLN